MRRTLLCVALAAIFLLVASASFAQVAQGDTITMPAGPDYARSGAWRFFWGQHHRDAWATPVEVPVLNLETFAGGLTPLSAGGGFQTKSLWLTGADGRVYAFRSVYKFADALVPEVFQETFVDNLFQDQMSTQHPFSPLVVESLLGSVGILNTPPTLYVLPDDGSLGEFDEVFGGLMGIMAERPDQSDTMLARFRGADEVIDGAAVLERVQSDPSQRVDSRTYLAARLIDVLVGDWDRHADQWQWASFPGDSLEGWQPIPRDRDQAFARFDGVLVGAAKRRAPMLTSFRDEYDNPSRLHYQARFVDRLYLTELDRTVWDSTAAALTALLTDAEIDRAAAQLPPELQATDGAALARVMRIRRDRLVDIAGRLYELMAEEPYVHATDVAEIAEVSQEGNGVRITIRAAAGGAEPYFSRTFLRGETKDVRLHLHGGDDRLIVRGVGSLAVRLRVMGGPGDDEYQFEGRVGAITLYDQEGDDRVTGEFSKGINRRTYGEPPLIPEGGSDPPPRHWGSFGFPISYLTYNPDFGLLGAYGYTWFDYGFRKDPYASRVRLYGALATALKGEIGLETDFRLENSRLFTTATAVASTLDRLHFYGIGNDSERIDDLPRSFYDVDRLALEVEWLGKYAFSASSSIGLGVIGRYSDTEDDSTNFIGTIPDLYGGDTFTSAGAIATVDLDTRRPGLLELFSQRVRAGVHARGSYYPAIFDVDEAYGSAGIVANLSVPIGLRQSEIGFRAGGEKIWGDAPWFDLAYVGGSPSLRGWAADRFAGDASLYAATELRLDLFDYQLIFPSTFGILGLADVGRVWVDGDSPGNWHAGYGGGIWLSLRGTRNVLSIAYATSVEDDGVYITFGFPF